ncbi:MAG: M15 family metallopeptidase [Lachnospiraceae bacterium]|nr:M15 family metallopeptidase [Lachnospiraceae bacterium]
MDKKALFKYLLLITLIILLCTIFARVFSGTETLQEYAEKNPETAYREKEPTEDTGHNINTETDRESRAENMNTHPERIIYKEGFYYEPLSEEIIKRITGVSYPVTEEMQDYTAVKSVNIVRSGEEIQVSYEDLRYLSVLHYNFKGIVRTGELICNKAIAQDLAEIFYELYQNQYQIEQIHLVDEYGADDTLSMQDNNTSCFNYRLVDGTASLSKHALGLAIDINPLFNPYVVYKEDGSTYISPAGGEAYADRSREFAYKIDENDLCYKLFTERGFTWGGHWNSMKDYQHFQKVPE